jgi:hypothetical protein
LTSERIREEKCTKIGGLSNENELFVDWEKSESLSYKDKRFVKIL